MSRSDMTTLTFDSLEDAARFARETPRCPMSKTLSQDEPSTRAWDNGMQLEESIDRAASGYIWDDGVAMMTDTMQITEELSARSESPRVARAIQGGSVSMGAYMSGHPRCMRKRSKQPRVEHPVLSIGIPLGIYWGIDVRQRMNFGAAMLSAVNQLERTGYRCEITALWRAGDTNRDPYHQWINIEYNLKSAGEKWSPASIAFCVAHPGFQRRLTWRIAETQQAWKRTIDGGYASNSNTKEFQNSMAYDFDIYFDNMDTDIGNACSSPEGAFEYVNGVINKMVINAKEAAQ